MTGPRTRIRRESGVVLALVMILGLVLSVAVMAFSRRAIMDTMIVRNRDKVSQAEALARSGVEIAKAVLVEQIWRKIDTISGRGEGVEIAGNTLYDLWAQIGDYEITTPDGAILRINIYDNGSRLNLNSLVAYGTKPPRNQGEKRPESTETPADENSLEGHSGDKLEHDPEREGKPIPDAEEYLVDFLDRVIENMDVSSAEKEYDTRELAQNLLDYIDADYVGIDGGDEEDYYQSQDPPYYPADRPMLSVYELGLVEGFDSILVEALQPYVTVYPLVRGGGINVNTAPPHVLGSVYHGTGGSKRLLDEDDVSQILGAREEGKIFCHKTETDPDRCITFEQADVEGGIYPPVVLPSVTPVYTILSEVILGDVERSVEAVINMSKPGEPRLLFWRMQ